MAREQDGGSEKEIRRECLRRGIGRRTKEREREGEEEKRKEQRRRDVERRGSRGFVAPRESRGTRRRKRGAERETGRDRGEGRGNIIDGRGKKESAHGSRKRQQLLRALPLESPRVPNARCQTVVRVITVITWYRDTHVVYYGGPTTPTMQRRRSRICAITRNNAVEFAGRVIVRFSIAIYKRGK